MKMIKVIVMIVMIRLLLTERTLMRTKKEAIKIIIIIVLIMAYRMVTIRD